MCLLYWAKWDERQGLPREGGSGQREFEGFGGELREIGSWYEGYGKDSIRVIVMKRNVQRINENRLNYTRRQKELYIEYWQDAGPCRTISTSPVQHIKYIDNSQKMIKTLKNIKKIDIFD